MAAVVHKKCSNCRSVGLRVDVSVYKGNSICKNCRKTGVDCLANNVLPVWYDVCGVVRYDVPEELQILREGEKMLICILSPYVPLHHIKNGTLGLNGHVCSFPQDTYVICNVLPRLPEHVDIVKLVKRFGGEDQTVRSKCFSIRRHVVLRALRWLKKYNRVYADIIIDDSNLQWMDDNQEASFPGTHIILADKMREQEEKDYDFGPAPHQTQVKETNPEGDLRCNGLLSENDPVIVDSDDIMTVRSLLDTAQNQNAGKAPSSNRLDWPDISDEAVNEYDDEEQIFCKAFPWLFPGGIGDFNGDREVREDVSTWAKRLLLYEDGRFARDRMWSFYALNYVTRRRNQQQGSWFVDNFYKNAPKTLDELKEEIELGGTAYIDKIIYYTKIVKGSNAYWRGKRAELYSWINHHIEQGNGAPTFFMTLSCAEYHWQDILRLINDRIRHVNFDHIDIKHGDRQLSKALDDYSIVVQEYFQKRVEVFLATVGKELFGIQHYWVRYEFAPSRGQIHAHLLAISEDKSIYKEMYIFKNNEGKQAEILAAWLESKTNMTASINRELMESISVSKSSNPCMRQYTDIPLAHDKVDQTELLIFTQCHECSDYCMRKAQGSSKNKLRQCRCGAGDEKTPGKADTPGFQHRRTAVLTKNPSKCFKQIELPRNHSTVVQSSLDLLQAWRANCDIQFLFYESNPDDPDPLDIGRVTDYVVAYACKGHVMLKEEKNHIRHLIRQSRSTTSDRHEITRLSRQLLNKAASCRTISKQECMVMLSGLDLAKCSETIQTISLSGHYRVQEKATTTLLARYGKRENRYLTMSMHQFFHATHKTKLGRAIVPHYVGGRSQPIYPPTEGYAKAILMIHKPWNTSDEESENVLVEFNNFIASEDTPSYIKIPYERVKERHRKRMQHYESVSHDMESTPVSETCLENEELEDLLILASMKSNKNDPNLCNTPIFDIGVNYDWGKKHNTGRDPYLQAGFWLEDQLVLSRDQKIIETEPLKLLKNSDGVEYTYENLRDDQKRIVFDIVDFVRQWIDDQTSTHDLPFQQKFVTIRGEAGTGKSVLINTLVTILRKVFQNNDVVYASAPTGTAAYNVQGVTLHRQFGIGVSGNESSKNGISPIKTRRLQEKFKYTVALIMDERSMISSKLLGTAEHHFSHGAFGGHQQHKRWGGVPVLILVGDDYQLAPCFDSGAFSIHESNPALVPSKFTLMGEETFVKCSESVWDLTSVKRQRCDQQKFKEILGQIRKDTLTDENADIVLNLKLSKLPERIRCEKMQKAIYLFATKAPMIEHNIRKLKEISSRDNPVAVVKSRSVSKIGLASAVRSHFVQNTSGKSSDSVPLSSMLCIGAIVAIVGRNFEPNWGLYNGSIGFVREIVFKPNENPNDGDMPLYVVVEFPLFSSKNGSPTWDKNNPKCVPIPCIKSLCKKMCCERTFLPLQPAFGKTIHTFQGQSVGPVDGDTFRNAIGCIICDIGTKSFEARCPGLFYTAISRATTIGGIEDNTHSAIYFTNTNMSKERITLMTRSKKTKKKTLSATKRELWVKRLDNNKTDRQITKQQEIDLAQWIQDRRVTNRELVAIIEQHKKRQIM